VDEIQRIYLVTEVWIVKGITMNVKVTGTEFGYSNDQMKPIGIVFRKCDLNPNGVLKFGEEVRRNLDLVNHPISVIIADGESSIGIGCHS